MSEYFCVRKIDTKIVKMDKMINKKSWMTLIPLAVLLTVACSKEEFPGLDAPVNDGGIRVGLWHAGFGDGESTRQAALAFYDRVEFAVVDEDGCVVENMKGYYDGRSSSIYLEGLYPGEYRMLIMGVKGDMRQDGAEFSKISHVSDVWLSFPEDDVRPLACEYFYSSTDFSVVQETAADGIVMSADLPESIEQKRIVGRLDMPVRFNNAYMEDAVLSSHAVLYSPAFYTCVSGDGAMSGNVSVPELVLDLSGTGSFVFMPVASEIDVRGKSEIHTRNYLGEKIIGEYVFNVAPLVSNMINTVIIEAVNPEDGNGTIFITDKAYAEGNHGYILQDDEPHSVYTDKTLRNFNTSRPLQCSVTDEGRLSVRFYSPKPLSGVLVRARIPAAGEEYIDLAYFDTVPAFADFYGEIPSLSGERMYRTESGKIVKLPELSVQDLATAEFRIVCDDPYWIKLCGIIHGWNIRFDLYGGDPTKPDGGPNGNWMGIRPVHCREAVAFFLNFTYMIDMPEHERILRENQDRLYGNGGVEDKVSVETVLSQMRQSRTLNVGLVYPGNGVIGLGGGNVFGAFQKGWFEHYTSTYACEIMFHELGHVMGYNHSSSFTYGPWAQELMNYFYTSHLSEMPVESPHYLNSSSNPNRY